MEIISSFTNSPCFMEAPQSPSAPSPTLLSPRVVRGQTSPFPTTPTATFSTFLEPPPGVTYAEFIRTWTDDHIAQWLADTKCSTLAPTFRANDIRGDVLLDLDQVVLKEMGVSSIGDRLRILNAVKALRQRVAGASRLPQMPSFRGPPDEEYTPAPQPHITRRLEAGRPAPLQLTSSSKANLPHLIRDSAPESARHPVFASSMRPLPQPLSASSISLTPRHIPPVPPVPKGQPPLPPPGRPTPSRSPNLQNIVGPRTPEPSTPSSALLTPSSARSHYHLPSDPRAGRGTHPPRISSRNVSQQSPGPPSRTKSSTVGRSPHPYAGAQPPLPPNLSPIVEAFTSSTPSPSTPTLPSHIVGNRPSQPGSTYTPTHNTVPSLDDLKRKHVKFFLPGSSSVTIDVSSCASGVEVLHKLLKKIGKLSSRDEEHISHTSNGGLTLDSWAIVLDWGEEGSQPEPLSESEIMSICLAPPDHPARDRGLTLRQLTPSSQTSKASKRASAISILSGLGVPDPEKALDPPPSPSAQSSQPNSPRSPTSKRGKLRNFFGQRPPSELITTHLTEFFPFTEKKVLERTARNSIMRFRRDSTLNRPPSRFSSSTVGSPSRASITISPRTSLSTHQYAEEEEIPPRDDEIPRVSLSTSDGESMDLQDDSPAMSKEHLLPAIPFPTTSLSESLAEIPFDGNGGSRLQRPASTMSKRLSFITELRSKRDRTDTASLVTVDEIIAEVENRRQSSLEPLAPILPAPHGSIEPDASLESQASDTLVDGSDDGEETGNAEVKDEPEERKWIKGALIGAGSFGKVYLGMDASTGFLMAVKQVELPSGSAPNESRKKSMLSALEREIELLQDLQHENIVQYYYSSMDDECLNIFLEYVPGGSVTALLRKYGAFEEVLVKNFVRQILHGLNYLHERDIIHRDIKGANILVDNRAGVKISDFGISKKVEDNLLGGTNRAHRPSLQGSVFWMAPEVVKQSIHTKKADIWSVGCLVVEMLTGDHPWGNLNQMQAIFKIGSSAKPSIPSDISPDAQHFLSRTFELDQEARPSAAELLQHRWLELPKKPVFPSMKAKAVEVAA